MPTRAEVKTWKTLRRGRGRRETGCFLAEGPRLVGELLAAAGPEQVVAVLCADDIKSDADDVSPDAGDINPDARDVKPHAGDITPDAGGLRGLLEEAVGRGVRVESVPRALIAVLSDVQTPQPVLAVGRTPDVGWDDVGRGTIVLLDGVQDPGNVGALVRTAVGLGAAGVVALGDAADPWGPKALRASAGATLRGPVIRSHVPDALARLAERGIPIWAAAAEGRPMDRPPAQPVALALGSEAHGLSATVRTAAQRLVAVPLSAGTESLGVAAAGAILLDRLQHDRPVG